MISVTPPRIITVLFIGNDRVIYIIISSLISKDHFYILIGVIFLFLNIKMVFMHHQCLILKNL